MPVIPGSGSTVAEVTELVRAILNDTTPATGTVFTDNALLPFANSAYRGIQRELATRGRKSLVAYDELELAADVKVLSDQTTPALPTDFLFAWKLWEKGTATSERYQEMFMARGGLPDREQAQALCEWEQAGDELHLVGATRAVTVKLQYEKALPKLVAGSTLRIPDIGDTLAYYTAAFAARSRGQGPAAAQLESLGLAELRKTLARQMRPEQRAPVRRRRYGWGRGLR